MHVCDQFAASGRAFAYSTDFIFIFGGSGVNKRVGSGVYGKNQKEQLRREPALACSCGLLRWVVKLMDSICQQSIETGLSDGNGAGSETIDDQGGIGAMAWQA